jgi:hypothetical protein
VLFFVCFNTVFWGLTMPFTEYADYMTFPSPERNPWRPDLITGYLVNIGAVHPVVTQDDVDDILFGYNSPPRKRDYHDERHGGFVGQPYVPEALLARMSGRMSPAEVLSHIAFNGLGHDLSYKHIDVIGENERLWTEPLERRIGEFATPRVVHGDRGPRLFVTTLTQEGRKDAVTRAVARIFDMSGDSISHVRGSNEFDSALASAQFLRSREAPPKSALVAAVLDACTIPFQPAITTDVNGDLTDGSMGELAWRLRRTGLRMNGRFYRPDWTDVNDIMLMGVHMGNRDISPLTRRDNFHNVIRDGRALRREEIPELRLDEETTMSKLVRAAGIERSVAFLYRSLSGVGSIPVPAANVPHLYIPRDNRGVPLGIEHAYPPYEIYLETVADTERNAQLATLFFQAHEVGIVTAAAIATLVDEPDAPVPGFVDAVLWPEEALPRGRIFNRLDEDTKMVFDELMFGLHQEEVGPVVTQRSPIGGLILGASGQEGVHALSDHIQDIRVAAIAQQEPNPFSQKPNARAFLKHVVKVIGYENFITIITQLRRVARNYQQDPRGNPERARRIERAAQELLAA